MKIKLDLYTNLIRDYLNNRISTKCFEYTYLKLFKEETREMSSEEYSIINGLFMDVEAFCDDPTLRDANDIDEHELRKRCQIAFKKLQSRNFMIL